MFKAVLVERDDQGKIQAGVKSLDTSQLPDGDVTVRISHSSINYKDGLVLSGLGNLVKHYPHVPGIDFAGTVSESRDPRFSAGDQVVLTGWRVGELYWGGLSEMARVNGDWLVHLPEGFSTREAMAVGTAGLTSMLALMALEEHGIGPESGPLLLTGAAGGVGSVACALAAQAGYEVEASTGRESTHDYLRSLGASTILDRDTLANGNGRPLNKEHWASCIDAVGGSTLANVLTQIRYGGAVASVGLAGGNQLDTTVIPFLLRGVALLGIDSVMCPRERRDIAWQRIARELSLEKLSAMVNTITLDEVVETGRDILAGKVQGRTIVAVNA